MKSCNEQKPVQFWLPIDSHKRLKVVAAAEGTTISGILRSEIMALLDHKEKIREIARPEAA